MNSRCYNCNSLDVVLCNYEYTCRQCGTVVLQDFIQDTFEHNFTNSISYESCEISPVLPKKFKKLQESCLNPFEKYIVNVKTILSNLPIDKIITLFVVDVCKKLQEKCLHFQKRALICVLIYYSSIHFNRGLPLNNIAHWLHVNVSTCRNIIPKIQLLLKKERWLTNILQKQFNDNIQGTTTNPTLARIVYELGIDIFPTEIFPKIINHGSNIFNKINVNSDISSMKTTSLISCCIYIACKIIKYKVKRTLFCKKIGISLPTLQKTESYIQQILKKNKIGELNTKTKNAITI